MSGKRGDKIEITHAEILDKDGNFYTENLRTAKQKNTYVLAGEGTEVFKPTFCWQGFRYIRIDEYPFDEIDLSSFKAIVVHSDMKRTGDFVCGNEKINQLYHNVIWGQKSNYIDVPTDCPQRNERLGFLKAELETRQGKISSRWYYKDDSIHFEFEIPSGTTAEITLPNGTHETVTGGKYIYVI